MLGAASKGRQARPPFPRQPAASDRPRRVRFAAQKQPAFTARGDSLNKASCPTSGKGCQPRLTAGCPPVRVVAESYSGQIRPSGKLQAKHVSQGWIARSRHLDNALNLSAYGPPPCPPLRRSAGLFGVLCLRRSALGLLTRLRSRALRTVTARSSVSRPGPSPEPPSAIRYPTIMEAVAFRSTTTKGVFRVVLSIWSMMVFPEMSATTARFSGRPSLSRPFEGWLVGIGVDGPRPSLLGDSRRVNRRNLWPRIHCARALFP
jgi:hypothetical protein